MNYICVYNTHKRTCRRCFARRRRRGCPVRVVVGGKYLVRWIGIWIGYFHLVCAVYKSIYININSYPPTHTHTYILTQRSRHHRLP